MKKIIAIIIFLIFSAISAAAKPEMNLDSIFANTLAFKARLDTAIYVVSPYYYPINDDRYIGNTYKMYRDAIKCYEMIKDNKMKKKQISEVIDCISKYYEPYFASLLAKPVKEIPHFGPTTVKPYEVNTYSITIDAPIKYYILEKPEPNTVYVPPVICKTWYNVKTIKLDGIRIDPSTILQFRKYYTSSEY